MRYEAGHALHFNRWVSCLSWLAAVVLSPMAVAQALQPDTQGRIEFNSFTPKTMFDLARERRVALGLTGEPGDAECDRAAQAHLEPAADLDVVPAREILLLVVQQPPGNVNVNKVKHTKPSNINNAPNIPTPDEVTFMVGVVDPNSDVFWMDDISWSTFSDNSELS